MKKILSIILIVTLLFTSLSACKKKEEPKKETVQSTTTAPTSTKAKEKKEAVVQNVDVSVDLKKAGRIDKLIASFPKEKVISPIKLDKTLKGSDYSIPKLPVEAFSDELKLEEIEYERFNTSSFDFINESQVEERLYLYGEQWSYYIYPKTEEDIEIVKGAFKAYEEELKRMGAKKVGLVNPDEIFYSKDGIYFYAQNNENYIEVIQVKENRLKINKTLIIKPQEYESGEVYYSFDLPKGQYVHSEIKIDKGAFRLETKQERLSGRYSYILDDGELYEEDEGLEFVNYDFAYMPGRTLLRFSWSEDNMPTKIEFTIKSDGKSKSIKFAQALGGIRLNSDLVERVELEMVLGEEVRVEHPQVDLKELYFDRTPENGYFAFVPAGMYNLKISTKDSVMNGYKTVRVPVNSGQVTEVIVPDNFTNSLKNKEITGIEQGIDIQSIEGSDDKVKVVFTILDEEVKSIEPSKENMAAYDGGMEGKILEVKPIPTPPEVVLLLDSSGSMKGEMEATISAAKEFINGLGDEAKVSVVDFDTEVKPIKATSKEEIFAALDKVKAKGATALDDSIAYGLKKLSKSERPILVAFTDGEDAIRDGVRGSKISRDELVSKINSSEVPIYTIGFGEGHDSSSLELFSDLSKGYYFPANNQNALKEVFSAINEKIGSTYEMTYQRPKKVGKSNVPVLAFVVDVSGSMNTTFYDFPRVLDDVKRVYAEVIKGLPDNVKMELITFSDSVYVSQGITQDKLQFLSALGAAVAGGGTNILDSIKTGYQSIDAIQSKQKALIYLTDAALEVEESNKEDLDKLYTQIKDKKINSLWIGMGIDDDSPFKEAALKTDGNYIASSDPELIKEAILKTVSNIRVEEESSPLVSIEIEKKAQDGTYKKYSASRLSKLSALPSSDDVRSIDGIRYVLAENVDTKSKKMAELIYGKEFVESFRETHITKRMKVDSEAKNEAMNLKVNEIVSISKLLGVKAPRGMKFVAVDLEAKHILKEQEVVVYEDGSGHPSSWMQSSDEGRIIKTKIPYMIPDYTSHFGLSYNNEGPFLASEATALTAKPIVAPGEIGLTLVPDAKEKGMMVFLVPDEAMTQVALYYYDDNYGYITVPLVGKTEIIKGEFPVKSANKMKMSELFDMELKAQEFAYEEIEKEKYNYQDLSLNMHSKIQGKLNVDLRNLISLRYPSANGDYYLGVSDRTDFIPQGIRGPLALAHGSRNMFKVAFSAPEYLKGNKSELFVDLYNSDATMPIENGSIKPANKLKTFKHEYFDFDVNDIYKTDNNRVILDVTIHDKKDGFSTRGITSFIDLMFKDLEGEEQEEVQSASLSGFAASNTYGYAAASRLNRKYGFELDDDNYVLALDKKSVIYDGTSRRGLLVYRIPSDLANNPLYLKTEAKEKFDISDDMYEPATDDLLEKYREFDTNNNTYKEQMENALIYAKSRYEKMYPDKKKMSVASMNQVAEPVNIPSINAYGEKLKDSIKATQDVVNLVKSMDALPVGENLFKYYYSSEATLSQGFGSIGDVAKLALDAFQSISVGTKLRTVILSERGQELLAKYTQVQNSIRQLPAISYMDEAGKSHIMVIPFGVDLEDLKTFAYLSADDVEEPESDSMDVRIEYYVKQTKEGHQAQIADMASALGGSTKGPEAFWTTGFSEYITTAELSKSPIDIGFSQRAGQLVSVINTADKVYTSEPLELRHYKVLAVKLIINGKESYAKVGSRIDNLYFSAGVAMPEIGEKSAKYISGELAKYKDAKPNTYDALRWRHHKIIYDFIAVQTNFEKGIKDNLGFKAGRIGEPYILVVKSENKKGNIISSIDLVQTFNELYYSDNDKMNEKYDDSVKMFNAISGIFATENEASSLVEGEGFYKIFSARPKDAKLLLFNSYYVDEYRDKFIEMGLSEEIVDYLKEADKMILIPTKPSLLNGEKRWAWLEIDEYSHKTIGVIDSFQRGAMSSYEVLNERLEQARYVVGAFKGVETSIWAVGGFSLELTDYKQIIASAKKLALGLADSFGAEVGFVGIDIGGELPGGSEIAEGLKKWFSDEEEDNSEDSGEENKGFKEGYLDGVRAYFKLVEADMKD